MNEASGWVLAVDTASGINVGLAHDGQPIDSRTELSSRKHVEELMPMIDDLLGAHAVTARDLSLIAVGIGPGPFTGLRIGIVTARTLGVVAGVPVRGFGSLDAIALAWFASDARPDGDVVVATDARRKELYWATYDASGERQSGPAVTVPGGLPMLPVGGPGIEVYPDVFTGLVAPGAPRQLDAALTAARIDDLPDTGLEPAYLRKPDAEVPHTRKSALASTKKLRVAYRQEGR
ncbi:tRNA (adenosine(37)-N6)-threonylcarbamoyltransferase complex dimerization subunit type 1 TsaB [Propionimicrobium sp. PCR01-08-3]|uniref:tRNA (adenosine(37)-N6)-threonylcarbamoyltransferase complex dimerization subunit type 1 TsaB n=1 Tax=Propionimicrobium sp. PCR01-08-3 TaxID=3052086 RepID=UPI00255D07A4|nr:tRNA (adenosine(37)-N6)-threonylcarbamoyltransferase complex dimerization subunit type 1 TsaB [Propionimicrobium sp. PCR01-08-3]WIY83250.1 tRNA (adenosine(37)-N6)-threonylcarbamoyltransferase complex dimerization subunit type 1 TsaB [Propionimicrobium sp. PCR01-08-3]